MPEGWLTGEFGCEWAGAVPTGAGGDGETGESGVDCAGGAEGVEAGCSHLVHMVLVLVSTTVESVVVTWTAVTPLWVTVLVTGQLVTVVCVISVVTFDTVETETETGDDGVIGELGVDSEGEGDSEGELGDLGVDSTGVVVNVVEVTGVVGEFGVDCSAVEGTVEGNVTGVDSTGVDCAGVDCAGVDCSGVLEGTGAVPDGVVVDTDGAVGYLGVDWAGAEGNETGTEGAVGTKGLDGTDPVPTGTDGEAYVEGVGTVVEEVAGVDETGMEVVEGVVGVEGGEDDDECGVQSNPML